MLNITKFNWKKFFINTEKVVEKEYGTYLLKNQVIEPQYSEWCKKVMWHGRHHNSQKSSINDIQVNEMTIDVSK